MATAALDQAKIPTDSPQPRRSGRGRVTGRAEMPAESPQPRRSRAKKTSGPARPKVLAGGTGRGSSRGDGEVIELECGISVYPARSEGGRWRAVWYEAGKREQCEASSQEKLAPKLEKVVERLQADAPNMRRLGADLIAHYLDPDRLPVGRRWSRKHADTQRRLCERFAAPVIAAVTCQDIKTEHTQKIVCATSAATAASSWYASATSPTGEPPSTSASARSACTPPAPAASTPRICTVSPSHLAGVIIAEASSMS